MPDLLIPRSRPRLLAVLVLLMAVITPTAARSRGSRYSDRSVYVIGHYRRNGTYVHSYYRSPPGTRRSYGYNGSYGYRYYSPSPASGYHQEYPPATDAQHYASAQPPQRADDTSRRAFIATLCVLFIGVMLFALGRVVSQPNQRQRSVTQASSVARGQYLNVCPACQRVTVLDTRKCAGCGHLFRTKFTLHV